MSEDEDKPARKRAARKKAEPAAEAPAQELPGPPAIEMDVVPGVEVFDPAYLAHQLRLSGMSWADVALRTGHPNPTAAKLAVRTFLQRAADQVNKEMLTEALALELARLDALQEPFWGLALAGSDRAATVVLQVMKQRSRLLGLEERQSDQQTAKTIVISGSREEYVAGLKAAWEQSHRHDEPLDEGP